MSKRILGTNLTVAAVCLFLAAARTPAQVIQAPNESFQSQFRGELNWAPEADYDWAFLTVSGAAGTVFEQSFGTNDPLWYDLIDQAGVPLTDGTFHYDLQLFRTLSPADWNAQGREYTPGNDLDVLQDQVGGEFTIQGGILLDGNEEGPAAPPPPPPPPGGLPEPRDQCFNDDVIVDGSICVGFDCICNENFGFDTLRLKENNLRIHFDDTSNSASFPNNDWRIRINDTTNGGASYFAVEDSTGGRTPFIIEAGAPNDSLRVDSAGRIGIKNNNPVVEIHNSDGDTPTLRLEQNGTSGFTPQTWDVAGNEAGFFVRDVTNGSKLSFRIQPNSPAESLFIKTGGIAIRGGTTNPNNDLTVFGDADVTGNFGVQVASPPSPMTVSGVGTNQEQLRLVDDVNSNAIATFGVTDTSDLYIQTHTVTVGSNSNIILQGGLPDGAVPGGNVGIGTAAPSERLHVAGNICATGTIAACSDERFKKNIKTLTGALSKLSKLRGVAFDWKADEFPDHRFNDQRQLGFIAQEINAVLPGVVNKGSDGYYSVDYGRVTPVLVEAVKELNGTILEKDRQIADLAARMERLEKLVAATAESSKSR